MDIPTNKQSIDWITRTIAILAAVAVITVCILAYMGKQIPPELNTLTGGLIGSLGSLLAKTSPTAAIPAASPTPTGDITVPAQKLETTTT